MKHTKNTLLYAAAELFCKRNQVSLNPEGLLRKSYGNVIAFGLIGIMILLAPQALLTPSFHDGKTNWLFVGVSSLISAICLLYLWLNRTTQQQKTITATWKPVRERLIEHLMKEAETIDGASPVGTLERALQRKLENPYGDPVAQVGLEKLAEELGMRIVDVRFEAV